MLKRTGRFFLAISAILLMFILLLAEKDLPVASLKNKYTNASSQFISLMGMQVHYRIEGPAADSIPILLLHGTSSSLHTWDSLTAILKKEKRIVRLDLPAFGLTGPNMNNQYNYRFYSQFLDSFLMRTHIKRCIVIGNSLGGGIAWHFALDFPSRVHQLVLIDASGYPKTTEKGSIGFTIANTPIINNLLLFVSPKFLIKKSLAAVFYNPALINEEKIERYHDMVLREGNRKATLSIFKNPFQQETTRIKNITQPTCIIWGAADALISVKNAQLFQSDIKGSKVFILEKVGHVPMEESPEQVGEIIKKFIKQDDVYNRSSSPNS